MTESYMKSYGSLEAYENGHQIRDMHFDTEYDGEDINFSIRDGDTEYSGHEKLDEGALMALFNCPSSSMSLETRLKEDFPIKSKKDKKNSKDNNDKKDKKDKKNSKDNKDNKNKKNSKDNKNNKASKVKKDTRKKQRHVKERNTKKK